MGPASYAVGRDEHNMASDHLGAAIPKVTNPGGLGAESVQESKRVSNPQPEGLKAKGARQGAPR